MRLNDFLDGGARVRDRSKCGNIGRYIGNNNNNIILIIIIIIHCWRRVIERTVFVNTVKQRDVKSINSRAYYHLHIAYNILWVRRFLVNLPTYLLPAYNTNTHNIIIISRPYGLCIILCVYSIYSDRSFVR